MRAINLLPTHVAGEKKERTGLAAVAPKIAAAAVPVFCLVLVVVGYRSGHGVVTAKQARVATLQAELAQAQPAPVATPTVSPDATALVAQRTARLASLKDVLGKEVAWDGTLGQISRVIPDSVWLTNLTAQSPTPADAAATTTPVPAPAPGAAPSGAGLTLTGVTYTQADVAALLERLQLLPTLTNVTLTSSAQNIVNNKTLVQFSINATIEPAGGTTPVPTPAATTTTPAADTTTTTTPEPTQ